MARCGLFNTITFRILIEISNLLTNSRVRSKMANDLPLHCWLSGTRTSLDLKIVGVKMNSEIRFPEKIEVKFES